MNISEGRSCAESALRLTSRSKTSWHPALRERPSEEKIFRTQATQQDDNNHMATRSSRCAKRHSFKDSQEDNCCCVCVEPRGRLQLKGHETRYRAEQPPSTWDEWFQIFSPGKRTQQASETRVFGIFMKIGENLPKIGPSTVNKNGHFFETANPRQF